MAAREASQKDAAPTGVTPEFVQEYAAKNAVCIRPLIRQLTDRETNVVQHVVIPCGSTRESVCPPCAEKVRRLRMQQCQEGWHLVEDPLEDDDELLAKDTVGEDLERARGRQVRSTRRRSDAADLPRVPMEKRSIGRAFTTPDGKTYRPSMFVTLTLGSYGRDTAVGHPPGHSGHLSAVVVAAIRGPGVRR